MKTIMVLRWIAFLPAAVITWFLANAIIYVAAKFALPDSSLLLNRSIPVIASFLAGLVAMYVGIKTAPSHFKTVAIIILGIGSICVIYTLLAQYNPDQSFGFLTFTVSLAGSALACYFLNDKMKEEAAAKKEAGIGEEF